MFINKDDTQLKWYWLDGKMHSLKVNNDGEDLNIKGLNEQLLSLSKEKEELCKQIFYLGIGLTGSPEGGWGFLLGWLTRSVKKDQNWQIQHTEEELPESEVKEYMATMFEEYAKHIREGNNVSSVKVPTPSLGGSDGTELFGK